MKKSIIFTTLAATILLSSATSVNAAESSKETNASIEFQSNNGGQGPEDNLKGNLKFLATPHEEWDFNKDGKANALPKGQQTFNRYIREGLVSKQYVAVLDDRPDEQADGWKVQAELDKLKDKDNEELDANIIYTVKDIVKVAIDRATIDPATNDYIVPELTSLPESDTTVQKLEDVAAAGVDVPNTTLSAGAKTHVIKGGEAATTILTGTKETAGKDGYGFEMSDVKLQVISGAKAGAKYDGKITWKLTNAFPVTP